MMMMSQIATFHNEESFRLSAEAVKRQSDPGVSEQPGRDMAEGPRAATAPDLTESEPQAQPAAQKPTGATHGRTGHGQSHAQLSWTGRSVVY
ncbi:hypothetical protein QTP86_031137 [Hemibagrus guttatus]|nr:hypothetical protein QTP86_031137 [Hemibagrus guttatus]